MKWVDKTKLLASKYTDKNNSDLLWIVVGDWRNKNKTLKLNNQSLYMYLSLLVIIGCVFVLILIHNKCIVCLHTGHSVILATLCTQ